MQYLLIFLAFFIGSFSHAQIPLFSIDGIYNGTKPEYKHISPLWGFVASENLLQKIRFNGFYTSTKRGNGRIYDKAFADDKIAQLLIELFPSPDRVQFTANEDPYKAAGKLKSDLSAIDFILSILLSSRPPLSSVDVRVDLIASFLSKPLAQKLAELEKKVPSDDNTLQNLWNSVDEKNKIILEVENLLPNNLAFQNLNNTLKSSYNQKNKNTFIKKYRQYRKDFFEQESILNKKFAKLIVEAFDQQEIFANPSNLHTQRYPKDIVIISLLSYFVSVADDRKQLALLSTLFTEEFCQKLQSDTYRMFTRQDYFKNKKHFSSILSDKDNPELSFLMIKGFENFEGFPSPLNFRPGTKYKDGHFADCGETSLRNIFYILLGDKGVINNTALKDLENRMGLNEKANLLSHPHFYKLVKYFSNFPSIHYAATEKAHEEWADVVSDLNENGIKDINNICYGASIKQEQILTFEIKSNVSEHGAIGVINMLNVIAKLLPDNVLNEPWDTQNILLQVTKKLDQFFNILSNDTFRWFNLYDSTNSRKNIEDAGTLTICITDDEHDLYYWQFVKGHFSVKRTDNYVENNLPAYSSDNIINEWMSSLFPSNLTDEEIRWPVSHIFHQAINSLEGRLSSIHNIFSHELTSFYPLYEQWLQKIGFEDLYSVKQLIYTLNRSAQKNKLAEEMLITLIKEILINNPSLGQKLIDEPETYLNTEAGLLVINAFNEVHYSRFIEGSICANNVSLVEKLLNVCNESFYDHELLKLASAVGSLELVKFFLSRNADPNMGSYGQSTMELAISNKGNHILPFNPEVIKVLIENKTNINVTRNIQKDPILHLLIKNESALPMLPFLLAHGADVNAVDQIGDTPLNRLSKCRNIPLEQRLEMTRFLIKHNADINIKNRRGFTPLNYGLIQKCFPLIELYLQNNANLSDYLFKGGNVAYNILEKINIHFLSEEGNKWWEIFKLVVEKGADLKDMKRYGNRSLGDVSLAMAVNHSRADIIALLVERGIERLSKSKSQALCRELGMTTAN